jgi:hypothetical protein
MIQFSYDSVSPELVQRLIKDMGNYGFDLKHTVLFPNEFAVSGHGLIGSAQYEASAQRLTVTIMERHGLSKLITDNTIHQRLLAALGRA